MIVLNDDDEQTLQQKLHEDRRGAVAGPSTSQPAPSSASPSARLLGSHPNAEASFEAPPAYPGTGYQTFPQPPPRPTPIPQDSLPPPASAEHKHRERKTWRRLLRALIVALIIYALGSVLYGLIAGHRETVGGEWPKLPGGGYDNQPQQCSIYHEPGEENFVLEKSLLRAEEGLFFVTSGDQLAGSVHFVYDDSLKNGAQATIQSYNLDAERQELLAQTKICVMTVGRTQGISISTPSRHIGKSVLEFNVTLSLPYTSPSWSRPHGLKSLRSNAKRFLHTLDIPPERYFVQEVDFKSSNEPITARSIAADSVIFQTTNGVVGGEFAVNKLLRLDTKNGYIESTIVAKNDPKHDDEETEIILSTTNNPIFVSFDLQSTASNGKGGKFNVEATTTNSPVTLTNKQLPLDAALTLTARTINSPATVYLAPAFEGTFNLETTNNAATVKQANNVDPAHRNRRRNIYVDSTGKKTTGSASWSKDESEHGSGAVTIASTNSVVTLYV